MSSSLCWHPVIEQESESLSTAVKWILEKEFMDGGTEAELGRSSIPFLRGMMAAIRDREDAKDVQKMLEAIEKHGAVKLWLQY